MLIRYQFETPVREATHTQVLVVLNHPKGWNRAGIYFEEGEPPDVLFRVDPYDPAWNDVIASAYGLARCTAFGSQPPSGVDTIVLRFESAIYSHFIIEHELGHVFGLDHTPDGLMGYKQSFPTDEEVKQVRELFAGVAIPETATEASAAPEDYNESN